MLFNGDLHMFHCRFVQSFRFSDWWVITDRGEQDRPHQQRWVSHYQTPFPILTPGFDHHDWKAVHTWASASTAASHFRKPWTAYPQAPRRCDFWTSATAVFECHTSLVHVICTAYWMSTQNHWATILCSFPKATADVGSSPCLNYPLMQATISSNWLL